MGMLINPDAQRKAHAEMDAVVGRERLPTAVDRPALPYLEAVLTEMLRWLPSATLGAYSRCFVAFWADVLARV